MTFDLAKKADERPQINDDSVIVIAGPTGSGKSALALAWAERYQGVVINADSMQLYADLAIVTARPNAADCALVPHELYGFVPATQMCSAAWWREQAIATINRARAAGQVPIITGGTGFYLDALIRGFSPMPDIPEQIKAATARLIRDAGVWALYAELRNADPDMAARLKPTDTQRISRAWDVLQATGQSLAVWQAHPRSGPPPGMDFQIHKLMPPREWLLPRLEQRFEQMLAQGAIDEVAHLCAIDPERTSPLFKAVGVPPIADFLGGNLTRDQMIVRVIETTRQYAKRQMTWLRHQL